MILIFPPVVKPSEPPAGLALLSGALKRHSVSHQVYDANIEGLLWLMNAHRKLKSRWDERALSQKARNLKHLRSFSGYQNIDRYKQAVLGINKLVSNSVSSGRFKISLSDFNDDNLSPVKSAHLIQSAENFTENPFFSYFENCLKQKIERSSSDHVGISICYLSQALTAFAMAGWIKKLFRKKIVLGGGLISSWMNRPDWKDPFGDIADVMIKGDGEHAVLRLNGKKENCSEWFAPDYDFTQEDSYISPGRILPVSASRGCYWRRCRFCPERAEKNRYKPAPNFKIKKQLQILHQKYKPSVIHFVDNALSPSLLHTLSKEIMPFDWYGFARISKELENRDFLHDLRKSGCGMLKLGLESGDQEVLDSMEKGVDLAVANNVLKALKHAGIKTYVYLLFGTPHESEHSALKTLFWVSERVDYIDFLSIAVFNMPRFSVESENLAAKGFYDADLSLYSDFTHPLGWDRKKVRFFVDRKFRKNSAIAPVVRRTPPLFGSNHAVFL